MHPSFEFVHLMHQNLSGCALFCHNLLAKVNTQLLKGLAMIFAGQENPFIIFRSKEINMYFKKQKKNPHKFAEIMKKNRVFGKFHS